ncbi:MAG: AraC family transcriptional regulator [Polaromonas sp.]
MHNTGMDILSDILQQAGLQRRLLDLSSLVPGTALRFPCDKSIGLHAVTQGQLFLIAPALDQPITLQAGDVALMARGYEHFLSLENAADAGLIHTVTGRFAGTPQEPAALVGAQVVSCAYQFWNTPLHPFLREMPPWLVLRRDSVQSLSPLAMTIGLLDAEARHAELGASTIVHGLIDAVFTYALREQLARQPGNQAGWSLAVRDPQIRRALSHLHQDCAKPWTLEALARTAGLSRTALAERFRQALGDTPLNHLRMLRMQKAMQLLIDSEQTLEQIAQAVGYQDAFGFSKVFKRTTGLSPRQFRDQDALTKQTPYRLNRA